jgi:Fe-S oxidoreductase
MCPTFRVDHSEAATPRAKANLLRALLDGSLSVEQLTTQEVRKVADLCINCRMCAQECPAEVNIPKLMLEVKAQHVAEEGMTWTEWAMGNVENLAAWASRFAWFVNLVMHDCSARWLIQRLFGLAARRRLPKLAPVHFLRLAQRRGWTAKPLGNNRPRVAYFVDFFANYFEPAIALATVEVLHHQGIEVYVPPGQVGCGMAPLAHGLVERARRMAMQNINVFADLARAGYTIICSEPTAALMLKHDYLYLVDDPDVALVAEQTIELTHYLAKLHDQGRLISNFQPLDLTVGHHTPCHLKALGHPAAAPQLLEKIPQLRILPVGLSCSGMAGTFGLEEKNMEVALRAGQPMLERLGHGDIHVGTSECSSCRLQMAMTGIPVVHPVQLLARAFKASGGRKSSDFF